MDWKNTFLLPVVVTAAWSGTLQAGDFSGVASVEYRSFFTATGAEDNSGSAALEPKLNWQWLDSTLQLDAEGFWRGGSSDEERDHGDIRVLSLNYAAPRYEIRAGIRKVFWGVTESSHLVDIINQTDQLEGFDGEDKLGQPMLNLALIGDYGTVDLFLLPGFRERKYPAHDGRLGTGLPVLTDQAVYESADKDRHLDFAMRYGVTLGDWDLGLSWFRGTGREPMLVPQLTPQGPALVPNYVQIEQFGLDLQATLGNWLWKLEAISRSGFGDDYGAASFGFEYSFFDLGASGADIGVLLEYLYDDRGELATTPFADDTMAGMRVALNDVQSSEALVGVIVDNQSAERVLSAELSRRIGSNWKLSIEGYWFLDVQTDSVLYGVRNDDFVQLNLGWYF